MIDYSEPHDNLSWIIISIKQIHNDNYEKTCKQI